MLGEQAFHDLLNLQEVDACRTRIRQRLRQLAEDEELAAASQQVARLQRQVTATQEAHTGAEMQQRRTQLEIDAVASERDKIQARMYSGEAGERQLKQLNSKEADLAARQDAYETRLLELMEEQEALAGRLSSLETSLAEAEAAAATRHQAVETEMERLQEEVAVRDRESSQRREPVKAELLKEYDYKRQRTDDPVAVPLQEPDGICGGCGLPLPPAKAKRVRRADRIISCESCGRMLCPARPPDDEA